ncbi:RICIN domain-containing protein [Streptomyces muensis]|uniref:RICIN domain-containing protein n=1 Tax=Streptomyces muensis TaxID=1077944 RepID=UPI00235995D5|nr:RICIN domain-containing protein [Streptomyces muensis]
MFLRKLAAVGAVVGLAVGLSSTPASAIPQRTSFENQAPEGSCLDFRADYGPYVFGCNGTTYQQWYWDDDYEVTALRQRATGLCLTLRNGQLTMKNCLADDAAAMWFIDTSSHSAGATITNYVSRKCLARTANNLVTTATCTGGNSQRWVWWNL